jgi:hypothetical protein
LLPQCSYLPRLSPQRRASPVLWSRCVIIGRQCPTTDSDLLLQPGHGDQPKSGQSVSVHYTGRVSKSPRRCHFSTCRTCGFDTGSSSREIPLIAIPPDCAHPFTSARGRLFSPRSFRSFSTARSSILPATAASHFPSPWDKARCEPVRAFKYGCIRVHTAAIL